MVQEPKNNDRNNNKDNANKFRLEGQRAKDYGGDLIIQISCILYGQMARKDPLADFKIMWANGLLL